MIGARKVSLAVVFGQFFRRWVAAITRSTLDARATSASARSAATTCGPCHGGGGCGNGIGKNRRQSRGHTRRRQGIVARQLCSSGYLPGIGRGVLGWLRDASAAADRKLLLGAPRLCAAARLRHLGYIVNPHPVQTMAPAPAQKTAAQEIPIPAVPNDHE